MRKDPSRWLAVVVLAALLGGCAAGEKAPATPPVDTAAINAAIDSIETAFGTAVTARDTEAVMNYYAGDARFLAANAPRVDGHDAIRASWVQFLRMPGVTLAPKSGERMVSLAGDMVVDVGSYTFKSAGPKGKAMNDTGKYVTVFRKVGSDWKAVVDIFNSDLPAAGGK
jgi:ketosteroid isomerase-like protein